MLSDIVTKELPLALKMASEIYSSDVTAIFKSNMRMIGEYTFSSYCFIVPTGEMPPFFIDNKKVTMHNGKVFPVNPGQLLQSNCEQKVDLFFTIHIDAEFIQEVAKNVENHSPPVFFKNKNTIPSKHIEILIKRFICECRHKKSGYKMILQSISIELAVELLRKSLIGDENITIYKTDIKKAIAFLEDRYQEDITLDDIAKKVNISRYHLLRMFKSETGKTPFEFLTNIKIQHAKKLLSENNFNMTEISNMCGFSNAAHFSVVFKKNTGLTPRQFRNTNQHKKSCACYDC